MRAADVTRNAALAVPLVLVNALAFYGQMAWASSTFHATSWVLPVLFAAAMESIALFLAVMAHMAKMAGDSAGKLTASAYLLAAVVGVLNYGHWISINQAAALSFGLLSAISPWLWGIWSRALHREQLRAQGLVEPRAVKFATVRWVLFPRATYAAFRAAVWVGETNPMAALALAGTPQAQEVLTPEPAPDPVAPRQDHPVDPDATVALSLDLPVTPALDPVPVVQSPAALTLVDQAEDGPVAWIADQVAAGRKRAEILRDGVIRFGVSESTMKRRYSEVTRATA